MNNNGNHGNKFFEGFIWGAIIGGGVVFLMGTKKGKKLLKAITQEGVGNLADIIDEGMDEDDYEEEEEIEKTQGNGISEKKEIVRPARNASASVAGGEEKPSVRKRFFRRKSS